MLIKKASQDARYGQLTRSNHYSNNSIHASSVTHPFEDDTLMVPRTKSLPTSRNNQVNRGYVIVNVAPAVQQEQPSPSPRQEQPPASGSGDILRRCVIL